MSLTIQCDRCTNSIPETNVRVNDGWCRLDMVVPLNDDGESSISEYHLCPDCYNVFIHFLDQMRPEPAEPTPAPVLHPPLEPPTEPAAEQLPPHLAARRRSWRDNPQA